jgi:hypothetical protein
VKKLKSILEGVKAWAELLRWYIVSIAVLALVFWRVWKLTDMKVPVDVRLLTILCLVVVSAYAHLLWLLRKSVQKLKSVRPGAENEAERLPEIEERLLSILWRHRGCHPKFFARRMSDDIQMIEYHLECLERLGLIYSSSGARYMNENGKAYVVSHGLQNLVRGGVPPGDGSQKTGPEASIRLEPDNRQAIVALCEGIERKIRMLIDRMENEKKKTLDGVSAQTTMEHTQVDLEAIDADLKKATELLGES